MEKVTSRELGSILKRGGPTIVLFSGEWCPDCRRFMPIWYDYTSKATGLRAMHVDVAREGHEWHEWQLREIPTVAYFFKGSEKGRVSGTISAGDIDSLLHR